MAIHIGELIKAEVELKRFTHKEFGTLINKNEKTVPDIFDRASMSVDLLITISAALRKDFLKVFYTEEPMKSLRDDEIAKLNSQIQNISAENKRLQRELALIQNLAEAQKETISFAKEQIGEYKLKLNDLLNKVANKSGDKPNEESEMKSDYASPENKA
jgi:uncharacterized protein YlxW (UPF0749 family)